MTSAVRSSSESGIGGNLTRPTVILPVVGLDTPRPTCGGALTVVGADDNSPSQRRTHLGAGRILAPLPESMLHSQLPVDGFESIGDILQRLRG